MMRKTIAALVAATTFGGAIAATAPAQARGYDGYGYRYYNDYGRKKHDNNAGVAIAAGVVGLALGAALASSSSHSHGYYGAGYSSYPYRSGYGYPGYGYGGYSGYPAYGGGYGYGGYGGYGYRTCESRRWVYDPYIGRQVRITSRYAC